MRIEPDSHRFFILSNLIELRSVALCALKKGRSMLDFTILMLGLALFVLSVGYAFACDRL
jgi:hypothetical protein